MVHRGRGAALLLLLYTTSLAGRNEARSGFGPGGQEYGYVTVRDGAHMFYWLYYADGGQAPAGRPLVLWLDGGPGASATSYGNFGKLGPLDPELRPRNSTWLNYVNLLFVDSPVGTGYSYVDKVLALARTNKQTSLDLIELTRQFLDSYPQFKSIPLYIFAESYGGKVAAQFALDLYEEMTAGRVNVALKGVVMGDSWLSGVDHVESWAPYLFALGMLDSRGRDQLATAAGRVRTAVDAARWQEATTLWSSAWTLMSNLTAGVNIYNALAPTKDGDRIGRKPAVPCGSPELMNGVVREALGVAESVTHQNDNNQVFSAQYSEFMQPATENVERLLNETTLSLTIYGGQWDVFTSLEGTMAWMERLQWSGAEVLRSVHRQPFLVAGQDAGFFKQSGHFTALWIHRAGHMIANDYPEAATELLLKTIRSH